MKNKKCDCYVGCLYDWSGDIDLYLDDYITEIQEIAGWEERPPKDYLDKRKGYANLFNYCPNCGTKINWAKLKKALEEII